MVSMISEEGRTKVGIYEYVIDTATELSEVPTDVQIGSIVYCIENSKKYMLDSSGNYVEVNFKKGGSGGEAKLGTKDIDENGSYKASDFDLDGWSQVDVNISGGGGLMTLLQTESIGHIETSSTSETDTGISFEVDTEGYDMLLFCAVRDGNPQKGYHHITSYFTTFAGARTQTNRTGSNGAGQNLKMESEWSEATVSKQGVYCMTSSVTNNKANVKVYTKYNSSNTGTINGDYTVYVYGINLLQGIE